ncbi:MAG: LysM peptidoglycan-binding domain-containing protein [Alkalibacterium sp.]|nr:LysM peptidoglycan-binding domain-containing protein [Alkalibacterium sp.]
MIYRGNSDNNEVALTFDDRANGMNVPSILQTLEDYDVTATFFIASYEDADQIPIHSGYRRSRSSDRQPLDNSSRILAELSAFQMREQLKSNEDFIQNASGETTKPFFRPPYGDYDSEVLEVAGEEGYSHTIMWTIDTLDWQGISSYEISQTVINNISPGGIVLMHTGSNAPGTPDALPDIITNLDDRGYEFVTVEEIVDTGGSGESGSTRYTVQAGDTLSAIAGQYGTTVDAIVSANSIADASFIVTGQTLTIPGTGGNGGGDSSPDGSNGSDGSQAATYTVQAGDTLWAVANEYGSTVDAIATENNISNPDLISIGQTSTIPGTSTGGNGSSQDGNGSGNNGSSADTYIVEAGDTLWAIANEYGTSVNAIASENNISNPDSHERRTADYYPLIDFIYSKAGIQIEQYLKKRQSN